jgi:fructokinase
MIICLGEALVDLVPPLGTSPADASQLAVQPGGAPLNVCVALNRLGVEAAFVGTLSEDAFGRRLARLLDAESIRRFPAGAVAAPTRLAVIDHTSAAAPFRFYGDSPADAQLSREDVEVAFEQLKPSGLYVSSLQLTPSGASEAQRHALDLAEINGIPVYCDPNPRRPAWDTLDGMRAAVCELLERSTLSKLSLDDAVLLGWPDDPGILIEWCAERFRCVLFVTGGSRGCWSTIDGRLRHALPPAINVVDPTGAGDASFAALVSRFYSNGALTARDLAFAASVGANVTSQPGAQGGLPTVGEAPFY